MDKLSVLSVRKGVLAKTWLADGGIKDYDGGMFFSVSEVKISDIIGFHKFLNKYRSNPKVCLVRGKFIGNDKTNTRRDSSGASGEITFEDQPLHLLCIDIDKYTPSFSDPVLEPEQAIDEFLAEFMPSEFQQASYVWQLSSSAGHTKNVGILKAHVWFWSETAYTSGQLSSWASKHDHVDSSLFRVVQPHYIADPVFSDGAVDPVPLRVGFKKGLSSTLSLALTQDELAGTSGTGKKLAKMVAAFENDSTAKFLIEHEMVKSQGGDGKLNIICPFADEHTGGTSETATVYYPANTGGFAQGHFDCKHDHCKDRTDDEFRFKIGMADIDALEFDVVSSDDSGSKVDWVARINGATTLDGLQLILSGGVARDKSLGVVALAQLEGVAKAKFSELGVVMRAEPLRKLMQPKTVIVSSENNVVRPDWLKSWVYIESTCEYANVDLADYRIKKEAFNAKYDRMPECVAMESQASQLALVQYQLPTVVDSMFFPKAGKFFTYEGKPMLNSFSGKGAKPVDVIDSEGQKAVDLFVGHVKFTLEREDEQRLLLDWMAYIYQNPGKRVGWAMLLQGSQGTGKSYFGNVFEHLMGTNVKSLDTGAISGRFTGWATGALVAVVEEIRIAGTNKYEILDKLKPIISNATIQIEEKGRDHRTVPNFTSYLLLTNHKDAVPLQEGDRRYCCLFSRVQSEQQLFDELGGDRDKARAYFDELFDSLRANAGAIARFLLDWKISPDFDPNGRAPETSARIEMKALSVSPDRDLVENFIEEYRCEVINDEFIDITWLNKMVEMSGRLLPKTRTLSSVLSEMGYSPMEGRRVNVKGSGYHYLWLKGKSDCATNFLDEVKLKLKNFHKEEDFD